MVVLDLREVSRRLRPEVPSHPHLRAAAIGTWRGRMINEHSSARVFDALSLQLEAAGLAASVVAEVRGFASEERRHGVLCGAVVEALGGEAYAELPDGEPVPAHDDAATPLEAALRNMLSICCLSETVAVSLIGAERLEMPSGELRDLLTGIYSDEVGHSRFGWRLLGTPLARSSTPRRRIASATTSRWPSSRWSSTSWRTCRWPRTRRPRARSSACAAAAMRAVSFSIRSSTSSCRQAVVLERRHDDVLDRIEKETARIAAAAQAELRALGRRVRGHRQVRQLVLDQRLEGHLEVVAEAILRRGVELRGERAEEAPAGSASDRPRRSRSP